MSKYRKLMKLAAEQADEKNRIVEKNDCENCKHYLPDANYSLAGIVFNGIFCEALFCEALFDEKNKNCKNGKLVTRFELLDID